MCASDHTTPFKCCYTCGASLPATSDHFYADRRKSDGLRGNCKFCSNKEQQRYRERHTDAVRERKKAYRERNRDKIRGWKRADYARHREERIAKAAVYHHNRSDIRNKATANYRERRRDRTRAASRLWLKNNPESHRANQARRRARKMAVGGSHTAKDIRRQLESQKTKCYWCGDSLTDNYHVDHVIPLDKGGSNGPENLVIACAFCNQSKGDKLPHEWNGNHGKLL